MARPPAVKPSSRPRALAAAGGPLAALALVVAGAGAVAQPIDTPASPFSGESFARVDLPLAPQPHNLLLSARRAWTWRAENTDRLILDRDVVVRLGPTTLQASRAAVWIEPVVATDADGQTVEADQVAIVFEDVTQSPGAPATQLTAESLVVTAVITGPERELRADMLVRREPDVLAGFVDDAERRFADLLAAIAGGDDGDAPRPFALPTDRPPMDPATRPPAIMPDDGSVGFFAEEIEAVGDERATALLLKGGAIVQVSASGRDELAQLTAERAVVFLSDEANPTAARYGIDDVQGVYLEGDIALTDGSNTLRGDRAYYDPATNRAVALDAVFFTFDRRHGMPVYLRADAIRQLAENQWQAENATLANVAFAQPQFSIGAEEITITAPEPGDTASSPRADITNLSLRAGEVGLIGLPRYGGQIKPSALRGVTVGRRNGDNLVETRWDLFTLLGIDDPPGNRADLLIDGYIERGPAGGVDLEWSRSNLRGSMFGYYIFDNGKDRLTSGARIDRDNDHRGAVLFENQWNLTDEWSLFLEGSYVSDETFADAFFEEWAETRREVVSSAYLRRVEGQELMSLEARGTFNDFLINEYLLQSRGYAVQRLPELQYARVGEQIAGVVSYTAEASLGRYELRFHQPTLEETGLDNDRRASAAFPGLSPEDRLSDTLRAMGFSESPVLRFDTRHEVELPLRAGSSYLVPFAVGRFTAYDDEFESFRAGGDDEQLRYWGSVGLRAGTSLTRVDDAARSEFFDVDRVRHIVEPSATVWYADANLGPDEFPVIDENVEGIGDGFAARVGIGSTWQTMRGAEGDKRSVDWITINANYVYSNRHTPIESPFGRFIDARPENSTLGEYATADLAMLVTDAVTFVGDYVYSFDEHETTRAAGGFRFDHGMGYSSFAEVRHLGGELDDTVVRAGARYELTRKYAAEVRVVWDVDDEDLQAADATIERRFAQWTAVVSFGFDDIRDIFDATLTIRPVGFGSGHRRRVFTFEDDHVVYDRSPRALQREIDRVDFFE